jgi:hypothetical protein
MSNACDRLCVRALLLVVPSLLLVAAAHATETERRPSLVDVVLEDADGKSWRMAEVDAHPLLVVVADRSASGDARAWGREIAKQRRDVLAHWAQPGRVVIVSAADLRAVPGFARGTARWLIAQARDDDDPGAPPLMLDWDGALANAVGANEESATVVLYAADGRVLLRDEGSSTPDKVARLAVAIDVALGASAEPEAGNVGGPGAADASASSAGDVAAAVPSEDAVGGAEPASP